MTVTSRAGGARDGQEEAGVAGDAGGGVEAAAELVVPARPCRGARTRVTVDQFRPLALQTLGM